MMHVTQITSMIYFGDHGPHGYAHGMILYKVFASDTKTLVLRSEEFFVKVGEINTSICKSR